MQYTSLWDFLTPAKKVSCISDLPNTYEVVTVDDLYEVHQKPGLALKKGAAAGAH